MSQISKNRFNFCKLNLDMMGKSLSLQRMPPHVARTQIMSADISWRGRSPGMAVLFIEFKI